jgi:murein DD-endopeptidase MepM/ murein hydrolase activator NlpD
MGIVGLLTVGLTTPADAVAAPSGTDITSSVVASANGDVAAGSDEIQAYVTPAEVQSAAIDRAENYTTLTMAQLATDSGISNYSNFFVNNPNSPIQWPFAVGVPISYGFGMRDGTMHEGVDFTPGEGSPIQAIADGVVRESTDSGGAFGVHIVIDHIIDGELVSSSYSHMLYGSRQVEVGDTVTVGTIVGHTGNTGRSFGAHTHFEILAGGTTPIDPIPWLREHAGG